MTYFDMVEIVESLTIGRNETLDFPIRIEAIGVAIENQFVRRAKQHRENTVWLR